MTGDIEQRKWPLLAYGIEKMGLNAPSEPFVDRNYTLLFEPFKTPKRFAEFDGVIIFQGIFESFVRKGDGYSGVYLAHSCEQDELDKRKKELQLLLQKGGFVCFLLCKPFIDYDNRRNFEETDLAKVGLNYRSFYRDNFPSRVTSLGVKRDEFLKFFELYGAAYTGFRNHNDQIDMRVLAEAGSGVVSMILWDERFFVPCLLPDNTPERIEEFFRLLCEALVSTRKKLQFEIPEWVAAFNFETESALINKRIGLLTEIEHLGSQLTQFERYKRVLLLDGDALVDSVKEVLEQGFGLKIDAYDDYKEDLKILNDDGQPIAFVEIKGTNRGVKREHVNQTDSHRERAGLPLEFPTVLMINTHIKNSRTLSEKDQEVAGEQVIHAKNTNVLILRTYDLLGLLKLHLAGKVPREKILELLTKNSGWLRVTDEHVDAVTQ